MKAIKLFFHHHFDEMKRQRRNKVRKEKAGLSIEYQKQSLRKIRTMLISNTNTNKGKKAGY